MSIRTASRTVLVFYALCFASPAWSQVMTDALVTGAYDGDTLNVSANIWPGLVWEGSVRVRSVDSPEINGQCEQEKQWAVLARDYVRDLLIDETVYLTGVEHDKYGGRVLARVSVPNEEMNQLDNLADLLIQKSYARAYDGGTRESWCGDDLMPPTSPEPPEETPRPQSPARALR